MQVRCVLFDVDETLVDHDRAMRVALAGHLAELGMSTGPEAHAYWRELEQVHYARYLAGELTFWEQRRERARGMTGQPLSDDEADAWMVGYVQRFQSAWTAFPDAVRALHQLDHLSLGVVTNLEACYQRDKLAQVGLLDWFKCVIGIDAVGVPKPEPEIFHTGCAALGVDPAEAVYVGDRLDVDALGARAAGLAGVWLDRTGRGGAPADVPVIRSLEDLPALVAAGVYPRGVLS